MGVTVIRHSPDPSFDDGAAVVRALAQEPSAVIYDLTIHNEAHKHLAEVFDAIDAYLRVWPGTPLLVCTAEPQLAAALDSHLLGGRVTTWASLDAALAAAERLAPPNRYTLGLDPLPTAPRQARRLVSHALAEWRASQLEGPAWSVVSELVANAVLHAETRVTASISRLHHDHAPGAVRLAVRDESSIMPLLIPPTHPLTRHGHGIWLVSYLASDWGTVPLHPGKIVWAVLDAETPP